MRPLWLRLQGRPGNGVRSTQRQSGWKRAPGVGHSRWRAWHVPRTTCGSAAHRPARRGGFRCCRRGLRRPQPRACRWPRPLGQQRAGLVLRDPVRGAEWALSRTTWTSTRRRADVRYPLRVCSRSVRKGNDTIFESIRAPRTSARCGRRFRPGGVRSRGTPRGRGRQTLHILRSGAKGSRRRRTRKRVSPSFDTRMIANACRSSGHALCKNFIHPQRHQVSIHCGQVASLDSGRTHASRCCLAANPARRYSATAGAFAMSTASCTVRA